MSATGNSTQTNFTDRLITRALHLRSRLIVGLDPQIEMYPQTLYRREVPLTEGPLEAMIVAFNQIVIEATCDHVVAYKPQVAFYEQYGLPGMSALQKTLAILRDRHLLIILDAKRNDVSHTAEAYAKAWLSPTQTYDSRPNPWYVDAITLNGYLGRDGIQPFLDANPGSGLFILAKTSNPSSGDIQDLKCSDGQTVYEKMALLAQTCGARDKGDSAYSRVGLVVGATYPEAAKRLREIAPQSLFLMPGLGPQAGSLQAIRAGSGPDKLGAYAALSRSLLYPYAPAEIEGPEGILKLKEKMNRAAIQWQNAIQRHLEACSASETF